MNLWITPADIRQYVDTGATTGRYSDSALGSNIRAAQGMIERETGRQFDTQTGVTKTLNSNGQAVVSIPDLRSATGVTLQDSALDSNQTYWLLPDVRHSGVYVAVQLRSYGSDYRANPQWFDRNLDSWWWRDGGYGLPNDLTITGDWGWTEKPMDLVIGVRALAAWLSKRADALLAGAVQNPDGSILDYSNWPDEARSAVRLYKRGVQMVAV